MKRALFPILLLLLSGPFTRAQTAWNPEFTQDDYDKCVTACWGPAPCATKGSCGQPPACDQDALWDAYRACWEPIWERFSDGWTPDKSSEFWKERDLRCGPQADAYRECSFGTYYHEVCLREKRECEHSWYEWYMNTTGQGPFHYTETPGICSSTSGPTATCVCRTFVTVSGKRVDSYDPETYKRLSCSASF